MGASPWIRFFPSDWLAGTRGMTAAETGVYITLVAMMYERAEPIAEDHPRLARLCGTSASTFKRIVDSLVIERKLQRADQGLWNARVGAEIDHLAGRQDAAREAGKASARARAIISEAEATSRVASDKAHRQLSEDDCAASEKYQKNQQAPPTDAEQALNAEATNQNQNQNLSEAKASSRTSSVREAELKAEFEEQFWPRYPHKVGKSGRYGALAAFLAKRRDGVALVDILEGVERYVRTKPPDRHWKNPATFLNSEAWLDQPAPAPTPDRRPYPPNVPLTFEAGASVLAELRAEARARNRKQDRLE